MRSIGRVLTAALAAFALAFSAASCKNDDDDASDRSVTMVFTRNNVLKVSASGYQNAGVFASEKVAVDGDVARFCLGILSNSSGTAEAGSWIFGLFLDPDAELAADTQVAWLYRGDFADLDNTSTMNRNDIRLKDGSWKSSPKSAWKTIDTSKSNITFTLTGEDLDELEAIWGN